MLQEWGPKIPYKIPQRNLNINFKHSNCANRHVKVYLSIFKKKIGQKRLTWAREIHLHVFIKRTGLLKRGDFKNSILKQLPGGFTLKFFCYVIL